MFDIPHSYIERAIAHYLNTSLLSILTPSRNLFLVPILSLFLFLTHQWHIDDHAPDDLQRTLSDLPEDHLQVSYLTADKLTALLRCSQSHYYHQHYMSARFYPHKRLYIVHHNGPRHTANHVPVYHHHKQVTVFHSRHCESSMGAVFQETEKDHSYSSNWMSQRQVQMFHDTLVRDGH